MITCELISLGQYNMSNLSMTVINKQASIIDFEEEKLIK